MKLHSFVAALAVLAPAVWAQPVTPTLSGIDPTSGLVGTQVQVELTGTNFFEASRVRWSRAGLAGASPTVVTLPSTYVSPTRLRAMISPALMIGPAGLADIYVENFYIETYFRSGARQFTILAPTLRLDKLTPNQAPTRLATGLAETLTLDGLGFAANAEVYWRPVANAAPVRLEIVEPGSTRIIATIPASLLTQPSTAYVFVRNPGGSEVAAVSSNELPFLVYQALQLEKLDPSSVPAGSAATKVTATGKGFSAGTRIRFTAAGVIPYEPTGQVVNVALQTVDLTLGEDFLVTPRAWNAVAANTPLESAPIPFAVTAPLGVTITDINPKTRAAGSAAFELTITGTGFASNTLVLLGTQFITPSPGNITPTQIKVNVTPPAAPGEVTVRVRNGAPATAPTSNSQTLTFTGPSITSPLNPASRAANSGDFNLTITGQGFLPSPTVTFNGQAVPLVGTPTAASVVVQITNSLIQTAGNLPVVVRVNNVNSAAVNFQVTAPGGPSNLVLNPNTRAAGLGAFTLAIAGQNLTPNPAVTFNGQSVSIIGTPTSTAIQVQVTAAMVTQAGTVPVRVTVGTQNATVNFTVTSAQLPPATVSSTAISVAPNGSTAASVSLASAAPAAVAGRLQLSFAPDAADLPAGYLDPALQFVNGGLRTVDFTIAAGPTAASIPGAGAFNVGTVAGTVTLSVVNLTVGGAAVAPPAPRTVTVQKTAPSITPNSARLVNSAGGVTIELGGYAPSRAITQATITFNFSSAVTVNGSSTFTVALQPNFTAWFASQAGRDNGSRFTLTIPFTVAEGDANQITGFSATLTNAEGTSAQINGTR